MSEEKSKMDLYEILTKSVLEMSDEELLEAMGAIREQRKVRIAATKAKSGLDLLLGKLTPANARAILQQLTGNPNPEAAETETEAEKK